MGNGWHEWPLVLFTVLGQCVAGVLRQAGKEHFLDRRVLLQVGRHPLGVIAMAIHA